MREFGESEVAPALESSGFAPIGGVLGAVSEKWPEKFRFVPRVFWEWGKPSEVDLRN
jgi:hypothetical protein